MCDTMHEYIKYLSEKDNYKLLSELKLSCFLLPSRRKQYARERKKERVRINIMKLQKERS